MFLTIELISYATLLLMSSRFLSTYRSFYISEAAFKYFLFSSIAIGFFFLAGLGFCFFFQTTNFKELALISCFNPLLYYLYFDNIFVIYLLFFFSYIIKIGAVPVHQWLIDAYEGTEISLLGYLIAIIGPVFQFKLFSLIIILEPDENLIFWFFIIIGFFCQSVGTIGAFFQYRIKRFFLFSGLTHLGFIFISLACGSLWGTYTAFFYTIIYIVLNFFLFLVFFFTKFASFGQPGFVYFTQLKTLVASNNFIFLAFVILLLSFSGFPPFATFFSKLFVFSLLVQHELFFLIVMFIFYTVINIFLYLRLLKLASFERLTVKTYFNITSWWYKIAVTRFRSSARLGKVVSNTFFPISVLIFLVMLCGFFILFMPLFLFVTFQLFTTTFFL